MSFIPEEELKPKGGINLAPMIDFLFLMLAIFASIAVLRMTTKDTDIDLVQLNSSVDSSINSIDENKFSFVTINIYQDGTYKWSTELEDYPMSLQEVSQELFHQHEKGILPKDKSKTHVMLKIDKKADWESILSMIFCIRNLGFEVHPLYEPKAELCAHTP